MKAFTAIAVGIFIGCCLGLVEIAVLYAMGVAT